MNYKYLFLIFIILIFAGAGCDRIKWKQAPIEGVSTSTPLTIDLLNPITSEYVNIIMDQISTETKWPLYQGKTTDGGSYWTISPLILENPQFWFGEKQGKESPQIKAEQITDQARFDMYRETHSKPLTKKTVDKKNTKITETIEMSKLKTTTLPLGTVLCHEFNENSLFDPNLKMAVLYTSDGWRFGAFTTENCNEAVKYIKMITEKFITINNKK
ncbi:MAG: hypothetical protein COU29_04305 [Candidatus Magasanikbacteria bacterium CG10_big_fil_rev_8_21_14_0_10_36_32]|uniref:Uncharacterized protein n=1 Tax=Candidatus Magasanikbacteria bacterium CG10_big_fil_rev_8_21_14_0_10_36_32 TaxID=1974646 RepID=A0A2M6W5C0_9BACT|nr:MAG: hypothetical protein COU29_04305 [Candidatus Magasanikbacteria bacterium CG10_big_fil_rev_8_21_14_0_10_36_32]